ncbi:hypothetical protein ET989_13970 [Propioniciclava sinopodophylli]|uniref:Uncharacterized protein n=1 Tax=Propioniciclava sinopodophylli TaxID=1837344 RepID=A0A4Q9KAR0_9ACTN|nr:hypothetical protein [Propioniciclava sinopodophylli]TBT82592.1 hypothetical protein ET989_13970 [Propioniciclava sinopodophylli]
MTAFNLQSHFPETTSPGTSAGLRWPSYRTGRVLTATDLTADQDAARERDRLLGRAAGHGIITGLRVSTGAGAAAGAPQGSGGNTLTVAPGAGITRSGRPVTLGAETTLPLLGVLEAPTAPDLTGFHCCGSAPSPTAASPLQAGAHLIAVRPAERTEGGKCAGQWTVAGLEFRAIALPALTQVGGREVTAANRRNMLAMWCAAADSDLGTPGWGGLPAGLFDPYVPTGLATLTDLTTDDLPLAVFWWDGLSVADLDLWSARRRIVHPEPAGGNTGTLTGDERIAAGQARFHQFTEQTNQLWKENRASDAVASELFGLLPPAGFLPVARDLVASFGEGLAALHERLLRLDGDRSAALLVAIPLLQRLLLRLDSLQGGIPSGFKPEQFFGRLARFGGLIDWDVAESMLRDSWHRRPVPTVAPWGEDEEGNPVRERLHTSDRAPQQLGRPFVYYVVHQQVFPRTLLQLDDLAGLAGLPDLGAVPSSQLYVFFVASWGLGRETTYPVRPLMEELLLALAEEEGKQ